jgi:hypothetical protein
VTKDQLASRARELAILVLQTDRYRSNADIRDAVDDVLAMTKYVSTRAVDSILEALQ